MLNRTPSNEQRERQRIADAQADYEESLAVLAIEHGTDNHDYTPEQLMRFRFWIQTVNAGCDLMTVVYWQHRVHVQGVQP